MKVILIGGLRNGKSVELPENDAKKLIKKGMAKAVSKPKGKAKKDK